MIFQLYLQPFHIRVVGDRFVFQSEVLFTSGSSDLQPLGRNQIARLAKTLRDISVKIPKDINWVLRVDGHTDVNPISTSQFPSNWELSTGRAISVVKQLVEAGIPAHRLAATGFGEFQPLDTPQRRDRLPSQPPHRVQVDRAINPTAFDTDPGTNSRDFLSVSHEVYRRSTTFMIDCAAQPCPNATTSSLS